MTQPTTTPQAQPPAPIPGAGTGTPAADGYPVRKRKISPTDISQYIRLDQCRRYLRLRLHERIGWVSLLQELWDRPGWPSSAFYDPTLPDVSDATLTPAGSSVTVELGRPVPDVVTADRVDVTITIGGVPLVVLNSPYRSLLGPLLEYVDHLTGRPGKHVVTMVIPEFIPARWWQHLLHNQTALLIKGALLFRRNVIVTDVPYHLKH